MRTNGKLVSSVVRLTLVFGPFVAAGGAVTWTVKLTVFAGIPSVGDITAIITAVPGAVGWKIAVEAPPVPVVSFTAGRGGTAPAAEVVVEEAEEDADDVVAVDEADVGVTMTKPPSDVRHSTGTPFSGAPSSLTLTESTAVWFEKSRRARR